MKFIVLFTNFLFYCWFNVYSQNNQPQSTEKLAIKFSGYIRSESFFDTYASVETRDGELYFYPKRKDFDLNGKDKNAYNQFEMLGLQSRLRTSISGGNAWGAKLSGMMEADFLGTSSDLKFHLRLRQAIIKMDWKNTQLLMGQYWHPVVIPEVTPNTVLFASGIVFHALNRPTQIRVTQKISENLKLMGAVSTYAAHRPIEPSGTNTQRNSGLPEIDVQLQAGNVQAFFASLTGGYKWLKPYLTSPVNGTDSIFKATKIVGSYHISGTVGYNFSLFTVKAQCNFGENLTLFNMIGGYAPVKGSQNKNGEYNYANMRTIALWTDFETKGEKIRLGLFAGYSKNLGTAEEVVFISKKFNEKLIVDTKKDLCRDADLESVYRIAPRIYYINGPFDIGGEYVLTGAHYGTFSGKKIIDVLDKSINQRILVSIRYTF